MSAINRGLPRWGCALRQTDFCCWHFSDIPQYLIDVRYVGLNRTRRPLGQNDANDPERTFVEDLCPVNDPRDRLRLVSTK
jgi:hypothetical protein